MKWVSANWVQLISPCVQFLGLILAARTVVWQLGKQHKNALALQRENAREALKLRIYESLLPRIGALSAAYSEAKMYAFGVIRSLESFQREQSAGFTPSSIKQRVPTFLELHTNAETKLAELIVEFESWQIAFPGLHVFKIAFFAAQYDVRQSFPLLSSALSHILPMELPPGAASKNSIIHPPPSPEEFSELKRLIDDYKAAMDEVGFYVYDLTIEAQNNLLHGLFEGKVAPRRPLDPRYRVISTVPENAQA